MVMKSIIFFQSHKVRLGKESIFFKNNECFFFFFCKEQSQKISTPQINQLKRIKVLQILKKKIQFFFLHVKIGNYQLRSFVHRLSGVSPEFILNSH